MAHPSVVINGVTYPTVPYIEVPQSGGGTATFYDASNTDVAASDVRNGKKFVGSGGEGTGSMSEKAAANYLPSTNDQTINANQFLEGAQTIKAVTTSNLLAQYIAQGVTVEVGCTDDPDCVAKVVGALSSVVVSQDSTTKVLSIS